MEGEANTFNESNVIRCVWCGQPITEDKAYKISGAIVNPSKVKFINELREKEFTVCPNCLCNVYIGLRRANSQIARGIIRFTKLFAARFLAPVFFGAMFVLLAISALFGSSLSEIGKALIGLIFFLVAIISIIMIYGGVLAIYLRVAYALYSKEAGRKNIVSKIIFFGGLMSILFGIIFVQFGYIVGGGLLYSYLIATNNPFLTSIAQTFFYNAYLAISEGNKINIRVEINIFQIIILIVAAYLYKRWKKGKCKAIKEEFDKRRILE